MTLLEKITPTELYKVKFYKNKCSTNSCAHVTNREFPACNESDKENFLKALYSEQEKAGEPPSVSLSLVGGFPDITNVTSVTNTNVTKLPPSMKSYYYPVNASIEKTEEITNLILNAKVTKNEIMYLENCSKLQRLSLVWRDMRKGRITASNVFDILHTDIDKPSFTVTKNMFSC